VGLDADDDDTWLESFEWVTLAPAVARFPHAPNTTFALLFGKDWSLDWREGTEFVLFPPVPWSLPSFENDKDSALMPARAAFAPPGVGFLGTLVLPRDVCADDGLARGGWLVLPPLGMAYRVVFTAGLP